LSQPRADAQPILRLTRRLRATRQLVFAAWTTPELMRQWMCPAGGEVVLAELDVRVGGALRIDMRYGADYTIHTGTYREVTPPEKLVFTWSSQNTAHQLTLVTIELFERDGGTELVLTQTGLPDAATFQAHIHGWTSILDRLADSLTDTKGGTAT
jgi:uncharacterized protein YndB with AHSA1/START domain